MSSSPLAFDSSYRRRGRRRSSLIEELDSAPAATTSLQQNGRPPLPNDSHKPASEDTENEDSTHQMPNSNSSGAADPPEEPNDTTNEIRVHRPNWARSRSTLNNSITGARNNNNRRQNNLLRSVSMRSSFTFGRRATAPPEHFNVFGEGNNPISSAALEGRNGENTWRDKKKKEKGGFIRRWSLDESNDSDRRADASELAQYQEVFQHMKRQNPTASLGALQQKTMKRMSELKVEKKEMERMNLQRLRESATGRHGSTNGGNGRMTLLGSLFHHRPRAGSDLSDRNSSGSELSGHDNNNNNNHHQGVTPKAPYDVDDSFRSNASINSSHRGVLSRATILISQSLSSNNNNQEAATAGDNNQYPSLRRSTIESIPSIEAEGSTDIEGGVPMIHQQLKASLILMGEDQKGNLAPRKSVGDLTALMAGYDDESDDDDDDNFGIDRSKASGLFISADEESKASALHTNVGEEEHVFVVDKGIESDMSSRGEEDQYVELEVLEMQMRQLDTSHRSHCRCGCEMSTNTFHSFVSEISNLTTMTEGSSYTDCSGSLIVGFGKQRVEKEDESRGFAADFSAWDERSQQF